MRLSAAVVEADSTRKEVAMPTVTSAHVETVRRGYEAFQMGDMDTLRSVLTADVVWHAPGQRRDSAEIHGVDALLADFGRQFQETEGSLRVTIDEIAEGDRRVVVLAHFTAGRNGRTIDQPYAHVFEFRGDLVSGSWVLPYDQAELADFWA